MARRGVALDIETIPAPDALNGPAGPWGGRYWAREGGPPLSKGNPCPSARHRRDETEEWRDEQWAAARKACSLSPLFGVVACAAASCDGKEPFVRSLGSTDEKGIIEGLFDYCGGDAPIVTFNGYSFDLQFLRIRSLALDVAAPEWLATKRYSNYPSLDLRMWLTSWDTYAKGTLDEWCQMLGAPCPGKDMGLTGADVWKLAVAEEWPIVEQYCMGDVEALVGLYGRLSKYI
jgi:hypothetical protein